MLSQGGVGEHLLRATLVKWCLTSQVAFKRDAVIPEIKNSGSKLGSDRKMCHTGMVSAAAMAPAHAPSAKCSGVLQNKFMLQVLTSLM
jgi:hypothetical protein